MFLKLTAIASLFFLLSCNSNNGTDKKETGTENTVTKNATDVAAQKKALNERSLACIALMNALETDQKAAIEAGDTAKAGSIKARIDSAAMENAKIGQQLMELDK